MKSVLTFLLILKMCDYSFIGFYELFIYSRYKFLFVFWLFFFRATPTAHESSQARGLIGATAAGPHHRHSNAGSKPCLSPTTAQGNARSLNR